MPNEVAKDKLKQDFIAMRNLPRARLFREIKARNCIHRAEFCLSDQKCWACDSGQECLEIVRRSNSLSTQSNMRTILHTLELSRNYIHSNKLTLKAES